MRRNVRRLLVLTTGVTALLGVAVGCQTPAAPGRPGAGAEIDPARVGTRDDITAVYQYYHVDPWLRNADREVIGFRSAVYFHSAGTDLGAFVPGTIMVWLYRMNRRPDGGLEREYVCGWELNEQEAMGYRMRKRVRLGYGYGFFFTWPRELDLCGRTIEIAFGYRRTDGRIIMGETRRFRVPASPVARPADSPPLAPTRPAEMSPAPGGDSQPKAAREPGR